jgi:phage tail-like protein
MEEVLLGPAPEDLGPGLEERIAALPDLLNPEQLYDDRSGELHRFLPWLAQWVALSPFEGLSSETTSRLISRIVPLYARRGTRGYLQELLALLVPELAVQVDDGELPTLKLHHARVGKDSRLGGDVPFLFVVRLQSFGDPLSPGEQDALTRRVRSVIELAKPAYTRDRLLWEPSEDERASTETGSRAGSQGAAAKGCVGRGQ